MKNGSFLLWRLGGTEYPNRIAEVVLQFGYREEGSGGEAEREEENMLKQLSV